MSGNYDIVVMGAGQNTLGAAAYLAKAGKKVIVLERNDVIGGGAVTLERDAPGFKYDKHSVVHAMAQANPMILNDELGLISQFGLQYFRPPAMATTVLDDYRTLHHLLDLDAMCAQIAAFSPKDAETYREFVNWGMRMLPMIVSGMFTVPLPMSVFLGILEQSEDGRRIIDYMLRSPLQIVNELFESDLLKIHLLRLTAEGFPQFPDDMGTGIAMLMTPAFAHRYGVGLPVGGSGMLATALARCIKHHGGQIVTECEVSKVLTSGGRANGVETTTGEQYLAKDAVIASIHPHHLDRFVDGVVPDVLARAKRTLPAPFSLVKIDAALDRPIKMRGPGGTEGVDGFGEFVSANTLTEYLESFDPLRHGRTSLDKPLLSGGAMELPGRHPEGKALLYVLSFQPYNLADGGPQKWDEIKEGVADRIIKRLDHFLPGVQDNILQRTVDSPVDMTRWSPNSMLYGDAGGIGSQFFHLSGYRPTPELAQYAVPGVERLYLCGPFMHPGGGVFGIGRPTAVKVCDDLGIQFERVVSR